MLVVVVYCFKLSEADTQHTAGRQAVDKTDHCRVLILYCTIDNLERRICMNLFSEKAT